MRTKKITWHNIRGRGKYTILKKISRKKGYKFCNKFLEQLTAEFIKENHKFYSFTDDWAFSYTEKQLHSIFLPALYTETDVCLREQPVKRQQSKSKSLGWLDYWAVRHDVPLLIEVKHCKINYNGSSTKNLVKNKWIDVVNQLGTIKKKELNYFRRKSNLVYKIGIVVAPIYYLTHDLEQGIKLKEFVELGNEILNTLNPLSDWCAFANIKDYGNGSIEEDKLYPGVLLFAYSDIVNL